jgi:hypothetical protein
MHSVAWLYNTSLAVARIFDMRIDFGGVLPMFGSDTYVAGGGRMFGKLLNVLKVADGSGREFDLGENSSPTSMTPAWLRRRCCSTTASASPLSMTRPST